MFCKNCGAEVADTAVICVKCGSATGVAIPTTAGAQSGAKSRAIYVLLAIFLGQLGIHNFYAGYSGRGAVQLVCAILSILLAVVVIGFLGLFVLWVWAVIEALTVTKDSSGQAFV